MKILFVALLIISSIPCFAQNSPLYVVDGRILNSSFNASSLSTQYIQSVSVNKLSEEIILNHDISFNSVVFIESKPEVEIQVIETDVYSEDAEIYIYNGVLDEKTADISMIESVHLIKDQSDGDRYILIYFVK